MKRLFEHSSFYWVRYDHYELKRDAHSLLYIRKAGNLQSLKGFRTDYAGRFESRHEVHESSANRAKT